MTLSSFPISDISKIGIVFLLFLLGLDMQPRALLHVLKKATVVTVLSALILFGWVVYVIMRRTWLYAN